MLVHDFHKQKVARDQRIRIAAANVQPKPNTTHFIPNTPYGVPKVRPQPKLVLLVDRSDRDWLLIASAGFDDFGRFPVSAIVKATAKHFNVAMNDMLSTRRTASIVRPRQIAMYLAKTMTARSLPEIGRRFGGRDHTTVLHAVRKMERLAASDPAVAEEIAGARAAIEREVIR